MYVCATEILKWKFLGSKCENVIHVMKSVIEFASALVNFSSTFKSIPLTSSTVVFHSSDVKVKVGNEKRKLVAIENFAQMQLCFMQYSERANCFSWVMGSLCVHNLDGFSKGTCVLW